LFNNHLDNSIIFNIFRLSLWPTMQASQRCVFEKDICFYFVQLSVGLVGCNIVQVFCILTDFLSNCAIIESQVLKSPTTVIELSIFPFNSVNFSTIYLVALLLGAFITVAFFLID
jgi:hypothetical protein